jgi:cytochrome P450
VARSQEAIFEIFRDHETFSSDLARFTDNRAMIPITLDPPEHYAYRKILLGVFSSKAVNAMLPTIRGLTSGITSRLAGAGKCEFVADVAEIIPVTVFMKLMGIPLDLMAPLRKLIVASFIEGHPNARDDIFDEIGEIVDSVIIARMETREEDVISRMIDSDLGGRRPTIEEIQSYVTFLTTAGLDTVTNAMAFTARHLAGDPELQQQVRNSPALIPDLIEEMLRRYAVSSTARYVTQDKEFRGVPLRKGQRVHVLVPAGNLDHDVYREPERVVLGRDEPVMTFGAGIHRCLGSHLARLELRLLYEDVLRNWPLFWLDLEDPPTESAGIVYSVSRLPLRWSRVQSDPREPQERS